MYKKNGILVVAVIAMLVVAGFGCAKKASQDTTITEQQKQIEAAKKEMEKKFNEAKSVDNDLDGLSDAEEKQLGTNSKSIDTDDDGLMDYDEVKTFSTNPLKTDTDGDGVIDGEEVRMRTNPKGPGKF